MLEQLHQIAYEPVVITIPEKDRKSNISFGLALRQRDRWMDEWAEKPVKDQMDGRMDGYTHIYVYNNVNLSIKQVGYKRT